jgi:hypothetical protein
MRQHERGSPSDGFWKTRAASADRPPLVVLPACETRLCKHPPQPDEFVGLPTISMQVGAAGVLGSLWLVDHDGGYHARRKGHRQEPGFG